MQALFLPSVQQQFQLEDGPVEDVEFEESDSDGLFPESEREIFQESDDDLNFFASDDEQRLPLVPVASGSSGPSGRRYGSGRQKCIKILGKEVCVKAACRLLGVGQDTISRLRSGSQGYRQEKRKAPCHPQFGFAMRGDTREKWPGVVMYLWLVYHSSAECLPTDPGHRLRKPEGSAETPFPEINSDGSDELDRRVNAFMTSLNTYKTDVDVHLVGPGTFKGERRELQSFGFPIAVF